MPRIPLPSLLRIAPALLGVALLTAAFGAGTSTVAEQASVADQAAKDERPVTVLIVRHAERAATDPRDPPLAEPGRVRAAALREAIGDAGVSAVYVTQYRRTMETAEPLASQLGLTPMVLAADGDVAAHSAEIASTILARHRGSVVLVVGHSNTIGPIARAFGAEAPGALEANDYDNLFVVTADGRIPARIVRARYGPPDP